MFRLAHVCLRARDLNATLAFYVDVMGFDKVFDFLRDGRRIGYYLRLPDSTFIEVFESGEDEPGAGRIAHLCFQVDDIAAARRRLLDHGIEASEPVLGADESYQLWFKDPNGIDIELHAYTPKSTQLTGCDVVLP